MESFIKCICKKKNSIEKLKLKINEDENFDKDDAFRCSCKYNNLSFVKLLLESGCNIGRSRLIDTFVFSIRFYYWNVRW